jgi:hypothetical protein
MDSISRESVFIVILAGEIVSMSRNAVEHDLLNRSMPRCSDR